MIVRQLITKLGFDVDEDKLSRYEKRVDRLKSRLFAAGAAAAAFGATLGYLTLQSSRHARRLLQLHQATGMNVEQYQLWRFAAMRTGIELERFRDNIKELTTRLGEAQTEGGEAAEGFGLLGIETRKTNGELKSTHDLLLDLTEAIDGTTEATRRSAALSKIFGDENLAIQRFLSQNNEEIRETMDRMEELGVVLEKDTLRQMERAGNILEQTGTVLRSLQHQIIAGFAPVLNDVLRTLNEWIAANRELIVQNVVEFLRALVKVLKALYESLRLIRIILEPFIIMLGGIENAIRLIIIGILILTGQKIIAGIYALSKAFVVLAGASTAAVWPLTVLVGIVVGLIALFILLKKDYEAWKRGVDKTVFGTLLGEFDDLQNWIQQLEKGFWNIWRGLKDIADFLTTDTFDIDGLVRKASEASNKIRLGIWDIREALSAILDHAFWKQFGGRWQGFKKDILETKQAIDRVAESLFNLDDSTSFFEKWRENIDVVLARLETLFAKVDRFASKFGIDLTGGESTLQGARERENAALRRRIDRQQETGRQNERTRGGQLPTRPQLTVGEFLNMDRAGLRNMRFLPDIVNFQQANDSQQVRAINRFMNSFERRLEGGRQISRRNVSFGDINVNLGGDRVNSAISDTTGQERQDLAEFIAGNIRMAITEEISRAQQDFPEDE